MTEEQYFTVIKCILKGPVYEIKSHSVGFDPFWPQGSRQSMDAPARITEEW